MILRLKNVYFGTRFTNYGVPFCSFLILRFLAYFGKTYRI